MFHQGEKKEMCVNDHYDDLRKSPKKSWGPVKEEEENVITNSHARNRSQELKIREKSVMNNLVDILAVSILMRFSSNVFPLFRHAVYTNHRACSSWRQLNI
jgi:hypothetical protein